MRPTPPYRVFIGWDAAEMQAHLVAQWSMKLHASQALDIHRLSMSNLQASGLYTRETTVRQIDGRPVLWDVRSEAPMTTGHAIARFFVPDLCHHEGWALFTDGDILVRSDLSRLFALADPQYAVMVVKHPPLLETGVKKDGLPQTSYERKNWSSVMLFNCAHPANAERLTLKTLNMWPGRDLHRFLWLENDQIGELPAEWNHLVGVSADVPDEQIAIAHYTLGTPSVVGHECDRFAEDWFLTAKAAGYKREAVA